MFNNTVSYIHSKIHVNPLLQINFIPPTVQFGYVQLCRLLLNEFLIKCMSLQSGYRSLSEFDCVEILNWFINPALHLNCYYNEMLSFGNYFNYNCLRQNLDFICFILYLLLLIFVFCFLLKMHQLTEFP